MFNWAILRKRRRKRENKYIWIGQFLEKECAHQSWEWVRSCSSVSMSALSCASVAILQQYECKFDLFECKCAWQSYCASCASVQVCMCSIMFQRGNHEALCVWVCMCSVSLRYAGVAILQQCETVSVHGIPGTIHVPCSVQCGNPVAVWVCMAILVRSMCSVQCGSVAIL